MSDLNLQCAALVGSRICHDLISPIGAINNGMELLAMGGAGGGPEMALITESVEAANARIRFFRIAYGAPNDTQFLGRPEINALLRDITRGSRLELRWEPAEDISRTEVQLAFLAIQCAEQALPYGGALAVTRGPGGDWCLELTSARITIDPDLWQQLSTPAGTEQDTGTPVMPAHVQFLLLPIHAAANGRRVQFRETTNGAELRF